MNSVAKEPQTESEKPKLSYGGQKHPKEYTLMIVQHINPDFDDLISSELEIIINEETAAEKDEYTNPLQTADGDGIPTSADVAKKPEEKAEITQYKGQIGTEARQPDNKVKQMNMRKDIKEYLKKLAQLFYPNMFNDAERYMKVEISGHITTSTACLDRPEEIKKIEGQVKNEEDKNVNSSKAVPGVEPKVNMEPAVETVPINTGENMEQFDFNENLKLLLKCVEIFTEAFYPYLADRHNKKTKYITECSGNSE